MAKTRELISRALRNPDEATAEELVEIAEQGVNYIVLSAFTDPENEAQIERLKETTQGIYVWRKTLTTDLFRSFLRFIGLTK